MELEKLPYEFTICRLSSADGIDLHTAFCFVGRTDEEISLVCRTEDVPAGATVRDDGWRGFRIRGPLDLSLIGILSGLTGLLAENRIGIFAVSTYDTDYILVKAENFDRAMDILAAAGYAVVQHPVPGGVPAPRQTPPA